LKKVLTVLLLFFLSVLSLSSYSDETKTYYPIVDDGYKQVDLDFAFPLYSKSFTSAFHFANGVIGFINPANIQGAGYVYDGLCCNGFDLANTANNYGAYQGVRFDYLISVFNTDLYDMGVGKFASQGNAEYQSFFWEEVPEYSVATRLNTFSATIYPLGNLAFNYQQLDIQNHDVSIFVSGDISANEYEMFFFNDVSVDGGIFWTAGDDTPTAIESGQSICSTIADASLTCLWQPSTYAETVFNNGCNASALYSSACTGYTAAYTTQQCGLNTLYDSSCTGYDGAYFTQQCGLDGLYDTGCDLYQEAYIDDQCETDPTYSITCDNYYVYYSPIEEEDYEDFSFTVEEEFGGVEETYAVMPVYEAQIPEQEPEILEISYEMTTTDTYAPIIMEDYQATMPSFDDIVIAEVEAELETFFIEMEMSEPIPEMVMMDELPEIEMINEPIEEIINVDAEETQEENTIPTEAIEERVLESEPNELEEPETQEEDTRVEDEEVIEESESEIVEEEIDDEPIEDEPIEDEPVEDEAIEDESGGEDEATEEDEPSEEELDEVEESDNEEVEEAPEEKEVVMVAKVKPKKLTKAEKKKVKQNKQREIIRDKLKSLAFDMGNSVSLKEQKKLQGYILALLNYNPEFSSYNSSLVQAFDYYDDRIIYDTIVPDNKFGLRNGLASEILWRKIVDIQWSEGYGTRQ